MNQILLKNPFNQELIGEYPCEAFPAAQEKVTALKESQKIWQFVPLSERLALVKSALQYFETNRETIAADISQQIGRPFHHSRGELNGFFERANYLCSIAEDALTPDKLDSKEGFYRAIEHVPLGTIFVISAWNYPLLITVNSVIPALIAGNTVLLKHSSRTPLIGEHFQKAFQNLGEHKNLLLSTIIDHRVTGQIIELCPIDHVIFTGSVDGGKSILKHTSQKFMTPGLELGGKDAAYVHSDADVEHAAETIVDGAMFNAGQSCCGIERAYIHEAIYDQFIAKAKELTQAYVLGDPLDPKTSLGPLAQSRSADLMEKQIQSAVKNGATILAGGNKVTIGKGTFFEATLIVDVDNSMDIMQEENFGPILPIMKVTSLEEAISLVNDSQYGLTSAIFTKDRKTADMFAQQANTGTVFQNRCDYLDPALPWTGVKNSGCGSSLSKYGFHSVTRNKSIHFRL